ncbi:hypothetical protein [Acanthopleuribacter pedis]|uniref:Transposase n=1 Tax=Acanthopleuribacter pedis TaxID=442870 RepID=A0A8J7Q6A8_9BACT|nr:hypothetical protein [Acanthopleuribacter pedis]MBO1318886.1 hypothetical protein [Acanthopleuribacter pedis]
MQAFDSPWKYIGETYLQHMIKFYHPKAHKAIDWTQPVRCLDKELLQLTADAPTGRREADKLFEVHRKNGDKRLVYLHIEFQNQRDPELAERMFIYYYRIFDKYRTPVWSMVILGDMDRRYRPDVYQTELWDLSLSLRYPTIKLRDYEARLPKLLRSRNPFALVTAAHLIAQRTRRKPRERLEQKLILTKLLYKKRFSKQQILAIFKFIDWVLQLSTTLTQQFNQALAKFEGDQNMTYITSIEQLGYDRGNKDGQKTGRKEGRDERDRELKRSMAQDLLEVLKERFGSPSAAQMKTIDQADLEHIQQWFKQMSMGQTPPGLFGEND